MTATADALEAQEHTTTATLDNGRHGTRTVTFETGRLARQAAGSVLATLDDQTVVLSATTAGRKPKEQLDFFPLTIDVEERMYAAGRIPGSFFRREGRPGTDAILTCRLTDRPLRPTFAKGLRNEVQVVVTVLSLAPSDLYDVLAINAASSSTQLSGLPFSGPVGATRVALVGEDWVAFPTYEQLETATFDMVVAGRVLEDGDVAIMMVEAEATDNALELVAGGGVAPTEQVVADGLEAAKPHIKVLCEAQAELARLAGTAEVEYPRFVDHGDDVLAAVRDSIGSDLDAAVQIAAKAERGEAVDAAKEKARSALAERFEGREKEVSAAVRTVEKSAVRRRVVESGERIDGRGPVDIRQLSAEVEILPRTHGSALFERGETQILGVTTLNMLRMEQMIDDLGPVSRKRYMHNYNFRPSPPGRPGAWARPSAARSATARSRSAPWCPCCPAARTSPTRSAR